VVWSSLIFFFFFFWGGCSWAMGKFISGFVNDFK
jgi:hypothetical protein